MTVSHAWYPRRAEVRKTSESMRTSAPRARIATGMRAMKSRAGNPRMSVSLAGGGGGAGLRGRTVPAAMSLGRWRRREGGARDGDGARHGAHRAGNYVEPRLGGLEAADEPVDGAPGR